MDFQIMLSGKDHNEFIEIMTLLAQKNIEAASAYESPTAVGKTMRGKAAPVASEREPMQTTKSESTPKPEHAVGPRLEAVDIVLQDVQNFGRELAAAGRGKVVQTVLAKHNVKLMSKIPEAELAEVLAELQEAKQNG